MESSSGERKDTQLQNFDADHSSGFSFKQNIQSILEHAPAMICIVKGPEFIFDVANEKYLQLVGYRDVIGKKVKEVLPEVENQGFIQILDNVYKTKKPYFGEEVPIKLNNAEGIPHLSYLDFVYQPILDDSHNIEAIFVHAVDVTEKVQSRKKLEESEGKLREVIDTVPSIIWMTNTQGNSIYFNKYWTDFTGQSMEDALLFGWVGAVHPEDRQEIEELVKEAHKTQEPYNTTFRVRNRKGEYRWVIDKGMPKYSCQGEFDGMIGTVVDVHEEKLKEHLVSEKEHRIRSMVEDATVATAVYIGREMRIEMANDAMLQVWGKDRSVVGKTLRQSLPELEGQPFHGLLDKVYTTGVIYWGKEDRVDMIVDGKMKTGYYNFTYKPLRDNNGEIYGILNMAVDVSEMVSTRNQLKESEVHFRQMSDLMPDKIINVDAKGKILYLNQSWSTFTGKRVEEIKDEGWLQFLHPEEVEQYLEKWNQSLFTEDYFEMELRFRDKFGKYKWHLSRAEAVRDDSGKIKMWIGTNTEIQKIKEEEKRKEDFLKMVSHELKTPVTSIKGYIQLLLSLIKSKDKSKINHIPFEPSLERIDHQIGRLTRLISEMLDLTRIEDNQLELQWKTFNLNDLIDETVQDINYTNTQHKIKVFHEYMCNVHADKDRIGQVLINLVTNAIKYSPDSQEVEVTVRKAENAKVAVTVKDFGIGIAEKDHKNVFKRFYRISKKDDETYAGFGIGLFLANDVINRHNGTITINSKEGKGSEFTFTLSVESEN